MNENKKKHAFWMYPSTVADIEKWMDEANATSKSDFVCKAVEFYIGYLKQQQNIDYLAPILSGAIKGEVQSLSKHISEMLFKVAVEQAINSNLLAWYIMQLDEDTIAALRRDCSRNVARNNGIVTFEKAHRLQQPDQYNNGGN